MKQPFCQELFSLLLRLSTNVEKNIYNEITGEPHQPLLDELFFYIS